MDIAALSTALSQAKVIDAASLAMLSKTLDQQKSSCDNMIKIMEQSVNPNLGKNVDILA